MVVTDTAAAIRRGKGSRSTSIGQARRRRAAAARRATAILVGLAAIAGPVDAAGRSELAGAAPERGACTVVTSPGIALGESIALAPSPDLSRSIVERAIESWETCPNYGAQFPRFLLDRPGSRSISVRYVAGSSGSRRCGSFVGSTITLYARALDPDGRPRLCGELAVNLAHEMGHALGLDDQYHQSACGHRIMAQAPERRRDRRQVTLDECHALSRRWIVGTSLAEGDLMARP